MHAATALGMDFTEEELAAAFKEMDVSGNGRVDLKEFEKWWRKSTSTFHDAIASEMKLGKDWESIKEAGGGAMFGSVRLGGGGGGGGGGPGGGVRDMEFFCARRRLQIPISLRESNST
jgi:hypothetical protein